MSHGAMCPRPDREGEKSTRVTTQPVRLPQNVAAQNTTGLGNPYKR